MKQKFFLAILTTTLLGANASGFFVANPPTSTFAETRCGWFVNPTPANAWLIGAQGGYQARGDWPSFKDSQWVKTNNNYGHGCACMKVNTNKSEEKIISIISAYAKPLSACRKDKALKGKEPN